ncbi:MAG: M20/M25/M40 family metallo-hydrolase, partial [Bacteroidia bacterium]
MKNIIPVLFTLLLLSPAVKAQKEGLNAIDTIDLKAYMTFFASDELEGREMGTEANLTAALYIKTSLMRLGLKPDPATNDFFQWIPLTSHYLDPENSFLRISGTGNDPLFSTDSLVYILKPADMTPVKGELVFAGYGFEDTISGYNDLAGIDLEGKVVLFMTENPLIAGQGAASALFDFENETGKFFSIFAGQPAAILVAYNPKNTYSDAYDSGLADISGGKVGSRSITIAGEEGDTGPFPIVFVTREAADRLLAPAGFTLAEAENRILSNKKPVSQAIEGITVTISTQVVTSPLTSPNVIGIIEGSDPLLRNECVVYTAHFDHEGMNDREEAYNGADDNASGSMGLLEIAEAYMSLKKKPLRTIVFAWVNGEEKGLLGSAYYTENPPIPMENTILNINLDMIGRSKMAADTGKFMGFDLDVTMPREIMMYTRHESTELLNMVYGTAKKSGVSVIDMGEDLELGTSDHAPFWEKGVPAFFFHSGIHSDLHSIRDDVEKIDFDKMERVSKMV